MDEDQTIASGRGKRGSASPAGDIRLGPVADALAYHLSIADALSLQTFLSMVGGRSRNARYIILTLIRENPGVTLVELSQTHFRDKSSMSPLIGGFIDAGLVRREKILRNGRTAQALFLTGAGERLWQELHPVAAMHATRVRAILGETDHAALVALLRRLSSGLAELERQLEAVNATGSGKGPGRGPSSLLLEG